MISEHGDELIADFREYYSVRLLDVLKFDGSLNIAEAVILARKLPPSSRTVAAVQGGDEYWGWDFERHVLVSILEAINAGNHLFASANSKKKIKPPKRLPRPGDEERKRKERENNPFALMVKRQLDALKRKQKGDASHE